MTIPVQICDYCQQEAAYVPLRTNNSARSLRVHFCQNCNAEYVYWSSSGDVASQHLYTTINERLYRWTTYSHKTYAYLAYVEEPGIPGVRPNQKIKTLQEFTDFPKITPSNINEKVRFMLPFL